jgi:hypothetical protein
MMQNLINALKENYTITIDREAKKYIGLPIEWEYINRRVCAHMSGYLSKAFIRFKHTPPKKKHNSPHQHFTPQYGIKTQYIADRNDSPLLNKEEKKYIQAVAWTLLYYGRKSTTPSSRHSVQ